MAQKDLRFIRSSKCADTACVEVAFAGDSVVVRDGKDVTRPYLTFSRADWHVFLDSLTTGRARDEAGL